MRSEILKAVIRPLHLTSKYVGLAPLNFENASSYTSFLIAFLAFATGLITVGITFESHDQENYDIIGLTLRAEFYLSCVLMGVNIFLAGYRQDSLKLFLLEIENVDSLFQKQRIKVDYLKAKQWAWLQVIGNLVIFIALQGITVLDIPFLSTYFLVYTAVTINKFLNTIVILQFTNGVLLLWQRFKWMNTKIESLQAKLGAEVVEFSKIHDKLCDIAKLLNGIYSIQLLISMAVRFMLIIAQLIKIYKIFVQGAVDQNLLPLVTGLFGFVLQVVTIFLLTWACSITANEVSLLNFGTGSRGCNFHHFSPTLQILV